MKNTHAQHGFTLVEISIVLVIIGLIVGGILVGRDLIHAAVIRADITAVQKMDTAVLTFKLKYNALPGDTQEATTFLGSAAYNGDGNGIIESGFAGSTYTDCDGYFIGYEVAYAIDHLARANLINIAPFDARGLSVKAIDVVPKLKSPSGFIIRPRCVLTPGIGICNFANGHAFRLGVNDGTAVRSPAFLGTDIPVYTGKDAFDIDTKTDDGKPFTGKTYSAYNSPANSGDSFFPSFFAPTPYADVSGCVTDNAGTSYNLTNTTRKCGLYINANF